MQLQQQALRQHHHRRATSSQASSVSEDGSRPGTPESGMSRGHASHAPSLPPHLQGLAKRVQTPGSAMDMPAW